MKPFDNIEEPTDTQRPATKSHVRARLTCALSLFLFALVLSIPFFLFAWLSLWRAEHFAISIHLPADGHCTTGADVNIKTHQVVHGKYIDMLKEDECKTYDEFTAVGYGLPRRSDSYSFGQCQVKVFSGAACQGDVLLDLEYANGWATLGQCQSKPFDAVPGRSIKVGKCTKRSEGMERPEKPEKVDFEW